MSFFKKISLALGLACIAISANAENTLKCPSTTFVSETMAPLLDTIIERGPAMVFGKKEIAIYEKDKSTGWILMGLFQSTKNQTIDQAFKHAVEIVSHVDKLDSETPTADNHLCIYYASFDASAWMYLQPQELYHTDKNLSSHMGK